MFTLLWFQFIYLSLPFISVNTGMGEEGIFRKAGAAARIKSLRSILEEKKGDVDLAALDVQPHDACDLLKQFFRWVGD